MTNITRRNVTIHSLELDIETIATYHTDLRRIISLIRRDDLNEADNASIARLIQLGEEFGDYYKEYNE